MIPGGDQPPTEERVRLQNYTGQPVPVEGPVLISKSDQPSAEEHVLQHHYDDLRRVIVRPLGVATQLVQEGVVSSDLE